VGRLAPEKNMGFLAEAVAAFLPRRSGARFLLVGDGPSRKGMLATFERNGLSGRIHVGGVLEGERLASAYKAMDVFVFASLTETQGMVLTEAMTAGVPVVAVDASGVREVVRDRENGRLVPRPDAEEFGEALRWIADLNRKERSRLAEGVRATARDFSMSRSAAKLFAFYETLAGTRRHPRTIETSLWTSARNLIEEEWKILRNIVHAAGEAARSGPGEKIS